MKKIFITFIVAGIVLFGVLFAFAGYQEHQTQGLINESKVLSASGKYQEALNTLIKARNTKPSDNLLAKINDETLKNEQLIQSSDYFSKGKNYFDDEEFETAIGFFKLVSQNDINYTASKTYIDLSEKKQAEGKKTNNGSIAGVSTTNQQLKPIPTSPINNIENLAALCEADAASFRSDARLKWDIKINQEKNKYSDLIMKAAFENLMNASLEQYVANIHNMANSRKTWCIEHNRNYSGFVTPEIKYEIPKYTSIPPTPMPECFFKHNCKYGCSVSDLDVEYVLNTISMHKRELETSIAAGGYQRGIWEEALKTDITRYESYCGAIPK